jgi:hypothetical protein
MHLSRDASFVTRSALRLSPLLAFALGLVGSRAARADDKEVCVRAVDHAQVARLDGKLRDARAGFTTCARVVCPAAIREDCTRWLGEVDASLPSVVFDAVWADGRDVTGMRVLLDGEPLAGAEGGRAIPIDPGAHTFRFEVPGAAPVETHNVIREGEKNRVLHVSLTTSAPPPPPAPAAPVPAPEPTPAPTPVPAAMWHDLKPDDARPASATRAPVPAPAYAAGGIALLGFGGFAYFGLAGTGQLDSLRSTCGHSCNPSDVNSARSEILVGDILAFVALAATGVATWFVLTRPHVPATSATR